MNDKHEALGEIAGRITGILDDIGSLRDEMKDVLAEAAVMGVNVKALRKVVSSQRKDRGRDLRNEIDLVMLYGQALGVDYFCQNDQCQNDQE